FYFEDVFMSFRNGNNWGEPEPLDSTVNGNGHDACIGISNDGSTLLIYKDEEGNGDIYTSQLNGFYWSAPVPLKGDVNTDSWEGSATFSTDMHTMYFSSDRPGGYGGRDIYVATLQPDGTWGNVKNMGPKINTPYDEDAPFLHPNGTTLIFSSQGHNSMGGYDIFRTDLTPVDSTFWEPSDPVNVGYPINTAGDDKYFVLATDGKHGYYSSGKPGGNGQQDIYQVDYDFHLDQSNVMLLSGVITLDDQPVHASVFIHDDAGKLSMFHVSSNSETGKYLITLPLGRNYNVTYELDSLHQKRTLDAMQTGQMQRSVIDIHFYTEAYAEKKRQDSLKTVDTSTVAVVKKLPPDSVVNEGQVNANDYTDILTRYGNARSPGLLFHVQVAAYNFPDNYQYKRLLPLGSIDKRVLDDGITRFTMGTFSTLAEAEAYRQKIIAAGQTDAFVTAEKDGKRYLLKDLAELHFFQQ
ncbi:MAG TPA: hypothetical protein VFU15_05985, partial [Bacteroidia bacterium]|nr:hypothetical protein [Bacteroidia bacterium]